MSWFGHEEESWGLELCCENANGRKTVPVGNINWNDQESYSDYDHESYSDYDEYVNDAANVVKLNQHLIMDAEILEIWLNEIMVHKLAMGWFQYWKTEILMKVSLLNLYWDAITTDAHQKVFIAHIRTNQESWTRSIHLVHLVWEK